MNKSLETINNYESYLCYKNMIGFVMLASLIIIAFLIWLIIFFQETQISLEWLIFVFIFLTSCVFYKLNKVYYSVDSLYTKTILKSFLHYSDTDFVSGNSDICKLSRFFKLYNQSSNPKINNIILDLDNKIRLLIDEDNKINGFGYVVTKACYDVIIEEIKKSEQEINEIKKLKSLEMTNHFRRIIN